jgi:hypothetical protein
MNPNHLVSVLARLIFKHTYLNACFFFQHYKGIIKAFSFKACFFLFIYYDIYTPLIYFIPLWDVVPLPNESFLFLMNPCFKAHEEANLLSNYDL